MKIELKIEKQQVEPKEVDWDYVKSHEGVYKSVDYPEARLITLHYQTDNLYTTIYTGTFKIGPHLEPAANHWRLRKFVKLEGVTVSLEIKE